MKEETRENSEETMLRHTRTVKQPNSRKAKENSIPDAGGAAEENRKSQANKIKREKILTTNQTIFTSKTRQKNDNQR